MPSSVRWLPLESNPEVINKYVNNLGVSTDAYEFVDIYGLDEELLQMVPRPVLAVLLLFPVTEQYKEHIAKLRERIDGNGQSVSSNLFYTKQTVQNACGTVAIIHALANNKDLLSIDYTKSFGEYLKATEHLSPEERASYLENDDKFGNVHSESAQEGQTETPNIEDDVDLHFIAFVQKDGNLYELDGAKPYAVNHGSTSDDNLLENTCDVVKGLMALNPDDLRFTLIGLVARQDD